MDKARNIEERKDDMKSASEEASDMNETAQAKEKVAAGADNDDE